MVWGAHTMQRDQSLWNTLFALMQVAIGLGLLYRRTVKPALVLSFGWALIVWWFGEAFGMLFMAPDGALWPAYRRTGAVALYALIGAMVWPNGRPGGLLGVRGARAGLGERYGLLMAWLWLEAPSSSANGISSAIQAAPSGMSWLSTVQNWATTATKGDGLPIALVLAALSLAIAWRWRRTGGRSCSYCWPDRLESLYWVFGQGFGGIARAAPPTRTPRRCSCCSPMSCTRWSMRRPESLSSGAHEPTDEERGDGMRFPAKRPAHLGRRVAAIIAAGVLLGGCAAADKTTSTSGSTAASSGSSGSSGSAVERVRQPWRA